MGRLGVNIEKVQFVEDLREFYTNKVITYNDIADMFYAIEDGNEWVYVTYKTDSQKRFSVNGMNNRGIMWEFNKFLHYFDDYMWIMPGDMKKREEK